MNPESAVLSHSLMGQVMILLELGANPDAARHTAAPYRGTALIIISHPLGPYGRTKSRALWWS